MKEIIVIQGASLAEIRPVVAEVAKNFAPRAKNDYWTIQDLYLSATSKADTFVLKPNKMCNSWDFSDICLALKEGFAPNKEVRLQAWMQLSSDTMWDIPTGQPIYIGFDNPDIDELDYTDRQGNIYRFIEEGYDIRAEAKEKGTYHPYPTLQQKNLPEGEGHFTIGEKKLLAKIRNIHNNAMLNDSETASQLMTLVYVIVLCGSAILSLMAAWDFSETLLSFSMPRYLPHIVIVGLGLLLASMNIIYKRHDFWGRLLYCIPTAAVIIGLAMTAVFSVNKWFHDDTPIYGSGTIVSHDMAKSHGRYGVESKPASEATQEELSDEDFSHNYRINVTSPREGTLYMRLHHDRYHHPGETVKITFYKGLWGMLYAEEVW